MGHFSFDAISPAPVLPVHLPVAVQKKTIKAEDREAKEKKASKISGYQ